MANDLADLKQTIMAFETRLNNDSLKTFYLKFEFYLLQINTSLKILTGTQATSADNHNQYLMHKQIETAINEIDKIIQADRHHPQINDLCKSDEYLNLNAAKRISVEKQQQLYPDYLAKSVQDVFEKDNSAISLNLGNRLNEIAIDSKLNGKNKTDEMEKAILLFASTKKTGMMFFSTDNLKPIKNKLVILLEIEKQTNMIRLFPSIGPKPSLES